MKTSWLQVFGIMLGIALLGVYVYPWNAQEGSLLGKIPAYKLGLDLHGGVELDYQVDIQEAKQKRSSNFNEGDVVESLKKIIEKRVNSLGTAEPNIQNASYGNEQHIIVQIPTITSSDPSISQEELKMRNDEYVQRAKEIIGKVVRLEFREEKSAITDDDKKARKDIAQKIAQEVKEGKIAFQSIGQKYKDAYENIQFLEGSGTLADLPTEVSFTGIEQIEQPTITSLKEVMSAGEKGYVIVNVRHVAQTLGKDGKKTKLLSYQAIYVNEKPSEWMPAKTKKGQVLDERYLTRASVSFSSVGNPQIELLFNKEGAQIFSELTSRLVGKRLAIFVGGENLTNPAPTVNSVIPDGKAIITGNYTVDEAKNLANGINTGIVPAPIYLTSERTIDAKIGNDSLQVIVRAGIIGFLVILTFLVGVYRFAGFLAGVALLAYTLILLALIRMFGIVLTLSSIAGVILSVGLAIDANILIFERTKEMLRKKAPMIDSIIQGFEHSWSAIWDSHTTSFVSAVILYIFGVSLIKGFGLTLGIGIVISLFSAMWISRILILFVAEHFRNKSFFIGSTEDQNK